MRIKAAKIVTQCLLEQGVDTVFGYPGSTVLDIYDELYRSRKQIRHILTSHEQGAAHAADAYSRVSGKPGVCIATSGPGATNLVTGIATAFMDSSAVVFITGNVSQDRIGKDSFQEVDITGIAMPITKSTYLVKKSEDLAPVIRHAFSVASGGRPGPVLVDILNNVTARGSFSEYECFTPSPLQHREPDSAQTEKICELIDRAERPLILAGGGIIRSGAEQELASLAHLIGAPVCTTMMGIGAMSADDPLFCAMAGMHGGHSSKELISKCDLLIAIGTRFSDRLAPAPEIFAPGAKIVHIDIDRAEIDKNVSCDAYLVSDARQALKSLISGCQKKENGDWLRLLASLKAAEPEAHPAARAFIEEMAKAAGSETVVCTDVGQHQMWTCQYYPINRPRQLITSGGYGAMGFGLSAAIGASLAQNGAPVIHITGDGSFRMNSSELATVSHYKLPIITVIMNNRSLGMVRQWQKLLYSSRYSQTTLDRGPDFVKLAQAYGITGARVNSPEEFKKVFEKAFSSGKAAVIDCTIPSDDMVSPSFYGKSAKDMTGKDI
ncbi:MAG: biosynthetic-type acetolactate synthase large subunit [Oscillospiraceae bacterium]|nr:biosynthetic-type acetolactate synthase large subunit [Oscillospiraceae bacterium]